MSANSPSFYRCASFTKISSGKPPTFFLENMRVRFLALFFPHSFQLHLFFNYKCNCRRNFPLAAKLYLQLDCIAFRFDQKFKWRPLANTRKAPVIAWCQMQLTVKPGTFHFKNEPNSMPQSSNSRCLLRST